MPSRTPTPVAPAFEPLDPVSLQLLRSVPPEERVARMFEMHRLARDLVRAGLRDRRPGLTAEQFDAEVMRLLTHEPG